VEEVMRRHRARALRRRYGRAGAVDPFLVRWYSRKYGLTNVQATSLLQTHSAQEIDRDVEAWREKHGLPAANSPLARGKVLELIRRHGVVR
jgi:hypothetical protein